MTLEEFIGASLVILIIGGLTVGFGMAFLMACLGYDPFSKDNNK